jgi:nucleotide-binding universal stress UspA family protein
MTPWESVVVGIDFSDSSRAALREAARLAHWQQCRLHIAHVISLTKDYQELSETSTAVSIVRDRVEQKLKEFALQEIEIFGEIDYHILIGHPFRELCQLTHDVEANLLVLGSCNSSGGHHFTGPIATNCFRKAPVPVLLVRATHDDPYHSILAAIDFSTTSLKAAEMAAEIAFENQSHLHLVHVHEPHLNLVPYPFFLREEELTTYEKREQENLEIQLNQYKAALQSRFKDLQITTDLIQTGKVSDALISFILGHQVRLAVIGTRGRTGLRSLLIGTTAERLVNTCPCSVLAIKPDGFQFSL